MEPRCLSVVGIGDPDVYRWWALGTPMFNRWSRSGTQMFIGGGHWGPRCSSVVKIGNPDVYRWSALETSMFTAGQRRRPQCSSLVSAGDFGVYLSPTSWTIFQRLSTSGIAMLYDGSRQYPHSGPCDRMQKLRCSLRRLSSLQLTPLGTARRYKLKMKLLEKQNPQQCDVTRAVLLLRYHSLTPLKPTPAYCRLTDISKQLGVSYNKVAYICRR